MDVGAKANGLVHVSSISDKEDRCLSMRSQIEPKSTSILLIAGERRIYSERLLFFNVAVIYEVLLM